MPSLKEMELIFKVTPPSQAIMLEGIQGIGKSEFITSYWKNQGYNVIVLQSAENSDAGDILGLPDRIELDGMKKTIFCPPWWWPKENDTRKILIYCDELNRAKSEIVACFHNMILNRELNGRKLPPDTRIILSINPSSEEYDFDVNDFDPAFKDRLNTYEFKPTYEELQDYAIKNKWNKYVIGFLSKHAQAYLDPPKHRKDSNEVYPSRRSWERVSDILNQNEHLIDNAYIKLMIVVEGIIGSGATSAFIQYIKDNIKGINPGRIIISWDSNAEKIIKGMSNQELVMLNSELVAYIEQNEDTIFEVGAKSKATYAHNIAKYFLTIPKEVVANFYNHVTKDHTNGKSWANKFLSLDDKTLVDLFIDVYNGESDHDKQVKNMLSDE